MNSDERAKSILGDMIGDQIPLRFKRMFGSFGVYANDTAFFAVIADGVIYFKTNASLAEEMKEKGAVQLRYLKNFFSLSAEILEDENYVVSLAQASILLCETKKEAGKRMTPARKKEFLGQVRLNRRT